MNNEEIDSPPAEARCSTCLHFVTSKQPKYRRWCGLHDNDTCNSIIKCRFRDWEPKRGPLSRIMQLWKERSERGK